MALEIFDGLPRNGKTYCSMLLRILPHLAAGGYVVTNVEVKPDGVGKFIAERYGKKWNPDRLKVISQDDCVQFFRHVPKGTAEQSVLVVLDEVHLWFNARDWQKNDKAARETFEQATQHGKYFLDIVLISQHLSNIDGQFLKLVAGVSRFRDVSKWKALGIPWLRFLGLRFLASHYNKDGKTPMSPARTWLRFDPAVAATYNTLAVLKGGEVMGGAEVMTRQELPPDPVAAAKARKLRRILVIALIVLLVAGNVFLLFRSAPAAAPAAATPVAAVPDKKKPEVLKPQDSGPAAEATQAQARTFTRSEPKVEVLPTHRVSGSERKPVVWVELDGVSQKMEAGAWCSRGRVAVVRRLSGILLHEVEIWDDDNTRQRIRVVTKFGVATGPGGSTYAPSSGVGGNGSGGAAGPVVAPGVQMGPPAQVPDSSKLPWSWTQ